MHSVRRCVTRGTRSLPLQPRASIIARVCRKCVCRVCVCTRACVYYISKCPYATRQTIESPEAIASETQRSSPLSNVNNRRNNTKQKRNTIKKKKKIKKENARHPQQTIVLSGPQFARASTKLEPNYRFRTISRDVPRIRRGHERCLENIVNVPSYA